MVNHRQRHHESSSGGELSSVNELKSRFEGLICDHQRLQSGFQLDHFVLARGGETIYAQYCQALQELESRYEAMKLEALDLERIQIEIELLEDPNHGRGDDEPFRAVDLAKAKLRLDSLRRVEKDRQREMGHLIFRAEQLKGLLPELTEKTRARLESEAWLFRIKHRAAMEILSSGIISTQTLEAITSFPSAEKQAMIAFLQPQNRVALEKFALKDHQPQIEALEEECL